MGKLDRAPISLREIAVGTLDDSIAPISLGEPPSGLGVKIWSRNIKLEGFAALRRGLPTSGIRYVPWRAPSFGSMLVPMPTMSLGSLDGKNESS